MTSSPAADGLPIGALAGRFGLAPHVLRHWETVGLLRPARLANGRRRYHDEHVVRVAVILRAKQAGLGLDRIRALLTGGDPGRRRATLERHRDELRRRMDDLRACEEMIECALRCPAEDILDCPNFRGELAVTGSGRDLVSTSARADGPVTHQVADLQAIRS